MQCGEEKNSGLLSFEHNWDEEISGFSFLTLLRSGVSDSRWRVKVV